MSRNIIQNDNKTQKGATKMNLGFVLTPIGLLCYIFFCNYLYNRKKKEVNDKKCTIN